MSLEGDLTVTLACDSTAVRDVRIVSRRNHAASRVFVGRKPDDAVALASRLFALCAQAQGTAAAAAVTAARGETPASSRQREALVALEAAQEDFWRLLVDWPMLADMPPDTEALARVRRSVAPLIDALRHCPSENPGNLEPVVATLHALAVARVFGEAPAAFVARLDEAALRAWVAQTRTPAALLARALLARPPRLGESAVATLSLDRTAVERQLLPALARDPGFARAPDIDGEPRETGALDGACRHPAVDAFAARDGNGACTRLFARLLQLASTLEALRRKAPLAPIVGWSPSPHQGVAIVRTARGLLLHRARIDGDIVAAYAIVAPTEWTFHPRGAIAQGLATLDVRDRRTLLRDARMLVALGDACVPSRVELAGA